MLCENCGKNQANVRYTQIINGEKKEMHLCEECSEKLGINNMEFKMPINFSSFFGDFLEEFEKNSLMPELNPVQTLKCNNCGLSFEEFMNTGKFGCSKCYDAFETRIDPILKNIHGSNRHVGRLGSIKKATNFEMSNDDVENKSKQDNLNIKEESKLESLKADLKRAIKEEKYEEAAKIRDEIKEIEKGNK